MLYLVHESACMKTQAVEEHLFAENVHFFNSDEQRGHTGPDDRTGQRSWIIYRCMSFDKSKKTTNNAHWPKMTSSTCLFVRLTVKLNH